MPRQYIHHAISERTGNKASDKYYLLSILNILVDLLCCFDVHIFYIITTGNTQIRISTCTAITSLMLALDYSAWYYCVIRRTNVFALASMNKSPLVEDEKETKIREE